MQRGLILFSLFIWTLVASAETDRPNVIILFTDDHGALDLNCFGSTDLITPNIDRLAASGIRFTQAYAHKVCCPSRAALLTGRHPQRGGVGNWTQGDRKGTDGAKANMSLEETTIAEVLQASGYATGLFGKWHLGAKAGHGPLDQGFDAFFGHLGGFIDNYRHYFLHGKGFHDLYEGDEEIFRKGEYFPDLMMEKALEFIEANKDKPFFATIAFNLPHYPEQPIGKFAEAYPDMPMPRQSYARVISTVDEYVGQVMNKLESIGQQENTIVILMGDNGYSREDKAGIGIEDHRSGFPKGHYYSANGGGGNTGKWIGAKGEFLEGGIRVPAIMSYPKSVPAGQARNQIVTAMDWFPTILDLANLPRPEVKLDGKSVLPFVHDAEVESAHKVLHFAWATGWAVREAEWKLIGQDVKKTGEVHYSLRNLAEENPEVKNHAKSQPEIVKRLAALHEAWESEVNVR